MFFCFVLFYSACVMCEIAFACNRHKLRISKFDFLHPFRSSFPGAHCLKGIKLKSFQCQIRAIIRESINSSLWSNKTQHIIMHINVTFGSNEILKISFFNWIF